MGETGCAATVPVGGAVGGGGVAAVGEMEGGGPKNPTLGTPFGDGRGGLPPALALTVVLVGGGAKNATDPVCVVDLLEGDRGGDRVPGALGFMNIGGGDVLGPGGGGELLLPLLYMGGGDIFAASDGGALPKADGDGNILSSMGIARHRAFKTQITNRCTIRTKKERYCKEVTYTW